MAPARHVPIEPYRQALLVAVWDYAGPGLASLQADLDALQQLFRGVGFDAVHVLANPDQATILSHLAQATQRAAAQVVRRSALSVVYFAGHGAMVGHTSWLLARDFRAPAHASDLGLCGGLACDHVAGQLAASGAPALLIVEACRTPLLLDPRAAAPPPGRPGETAGASSSGYACFFAQAPGRIVEVPPRAAGETGPLATAMQGATGIGGNARNFLATVANHLRLATARLRHAWQPQYIDQGAGEIHFFFSDAERAADLATWQRVRSTHSLSLLDQFLAVHRGSRHRGEALRLRARLQAEAGAGVPRALAGTAPAMAPPRTPRFWRAAQVQPVQCDATDILAGRCPVVEAQARNRLTRAGAANRRLDIAAVMGATRFNEAAATPFERSLAIFERLLGLGVPASAMVFQTLKASDLPDAPATSLLR